MAKEPGERPESAGALIASAALVLRTASYSKPVPATRDLAPPEAAPVPAKPTPVAPKPAPVPPALPAEPPARYRPPLRARLAALGPMLLVLLVAIGFGALLGMPGASSEQAANPVRSADELAVNRLDDVRFRLRDELAFAATTDEQARAAQRLAMAYGRAADHMTEPALVSAAEEASLAYLALESAARAGDQDAYDTARARVEAAEKRLEDELAHINRSRAAG
jgi:hypothetical protein